jgi:hypothetical protein
MAEKPDRVSMGLSRGFVLTSLLIVAGVVMMGIIVTIIVMG